MNKYNNNDASLVTNQIPTKNVISQSTNTETCPDLQTDGKTVDASTQAKDIDQNNPELCRGK